MNFKTILTLFLLLLISTSIDAKDLLDSVKSNSKLICELKDCYRAFKINHIIVEQAELMAINADDNPSVLKNLFTEFIRTCDSLKQTRFYDEKLAGFISNYLSMTAQDYRIGIEKGVDSRAFKKSLEKNLPEVKKYMNYLHSAYSTSHFISLTEDKYWETIDKKNYIHSADYAKYESIKKTSLKTSLALLENILKQTTDFQESAIYQIEIADQYEKHGDSIAENASELALGKYKSILTQKKYCLYLFESWLKWRTVSQQHNGMSKSSDIPNDEYNIPREEVAALILDFVSKNEKDEMAINEFLLMATHDNIRRFGPYTFGNQNTVEYHEIFDEKK